MSSSGSKENDPFGPVITELAPPAGMNTSVTDLAVLVTPGTSVFPVFKLSINVCNVVKNPPAPINAFNVVLSFNAFTTDSANPAAFVIDSFILAAKFITCSTWPPSFIIVAAYCC